MGYGYYFDAIEHYPLSFDLPPGVGLLGRIGTRSSDLTGVWWIISLVSIAWQLQRLTVI